MHTVNVQLTFLIFAVKQQYDEHSMDLLTTTQSFNKLGYGMHILHTLIKMRTYLWRIL